ncbi:hypothetical protein ACWDSD_28680 [Streptomyces spiralis]|uniref:Uncharacterized protein n=1 Tax=Streptomyces spiralis TaxID=66376 RepID=A0A919DN86_9ACTN|nr:hypothetical protein [Streptomyces spiralis]GHE59281.1 hypothetical protein GCM10014715_10650 [Streptomyces spiralis]
MAAGEKRRDSEAAPSPETEGAMVGTAPETLQHAEPTREEARDSERSWFLDTDTGELKPDEPDQRSGRDPQSGPRAVRVSRWTFD